MVILNIIFENVDHFYNSGVPSNPENLLKVAIYLGILPIFIAGLTGFVYSKFIRIMKGGE